MNTNPDALALDMVIMLLADDDDLWNELEDVVARASDVARDKAGALYAALTERREAP